MSTTNPFAPAEDSREETARLKVKQKLEEQKQIHRDPLSAKLGDAVNTIEKMSLSPLEEAARVAVPAALGKIPLPIVSTLLAKGAEATLSYKIQSDAQALMAAAMTLYEKGGGDPSRVQMIKMSALLEESVITKIRNAYQNVSAVLNTLVKKADGVPLNLDQADKILWCLALGELSLATLAENLKLLKFYVEVMEKEVEAAEDTFTNVLKPAIAHRQVFYYLTHPGDVEGRKKFVGEEVEMQPMAKKEGA